MYTLVDAKIDETFFAGNAFIIKNVELRCTEGRRDLVLHDFAASARADYAIAFLDGLYAADVQANGGVKLEGATTSGSFRIAEHDANFFANLVDEDKTGARLGDNGSELAQSLGHQARLETHLRIAHLAFELGLGNE